MSGNEKKANSNTSNKIFAEHIRHIFFITCVTRKSYLVVVENNGKEMYKKKCAARAKFFSLLFGLLTFLQLSLPSPFSIARVTYKNNYESLAFIPG